MISPRMFRLYMHKAENQDIWVAKQPEPKDLDSYVKMIFKLNQEEQE